MQTLLLASSGKFITANNIDYILPKPIGECKIAYVITASKKVTDTDYIDRHRQKMTELNFSYTEIDIEGKNQNQLRSALQGYDIILVEGGNTFYLLKAVRDSGFGEIVKDLLKQGVVYIGSSAGSYIACPTITMAAWSNRYDHCGITEYSAMNLVPFLVYAHCTPDQLDFLTQQAKNLSLPLRVLSDEQAVLVQDGKVQMLGVGTEIIL